MVVNADAMSLLNSITARIGTVVARCEATIIASFGLTMAVIVCLDVAFRLFVTPESMWDNVVLKLVGPATHRDWGFTIARCLNASVATFFMFAAIRSRRQNKFAKLPTTTTPREDARKISSFRLGRDLLHASGIVFVVYACFLLAFGYGDRSREMCSASSLRCGFLWDGVIWSQPLALAMTLWMGFLGACVAARCDDLLRIEAPIRLLPESLQPIFRRLGNIISAFLCILLAYLSYVYTLALYEPYAISEGLGGLYDGIAIPKFLSFAIVPIVFFTMAIRLLIFAFRGDSPAPQETRT